MAPGTYAEKQTGGAVNRQLRDIFENPFFKAAVYLVVILFAAYWKDTMSGIKDFMAASIRDRAEIRTALSEHRTAQAGTDATTAAELAALTKAVDNLANKLDASIGREAQFQARDRAYKAGGGK